MPAAWSGELPPEAARAAGAGRTEQPGERATALRYVTYASVSVVSRYADVYNVTYARQKISVWINPSAGIIHKYI